MVSPAWILSFYQTTICSLCACSPEPVCLSIYITFFTINSQTIITASILRWVVSLCKISTLYISMYSIFQFHSTKQVIWCRMVIIQTNRTVYMSTYPFCTMSAIRPENIVYIVCSKLAEPGLTLYMYLCNLANFAVLNTFL